MAPQPSVTLDSQRPEISIHGATIFSPSVSSLSKFPFDFFFQTHLLPSQFSWISPSFGSPRAWIAFATLALDFHGLVERDKSFLPLLTFFGLSPMPHQQIRLE
jgi:hypothetical protein